MLRYITYRLLIFSSLIAYSTQLPASTVDASFGGEGMDNARATILLQDGGYLMAGARDMEGVHSKSLGYLIRLDSEGNLLWEKSLSTSGLNQITHILEKPDGNFIAVLEDFGERDRPGQVVLWNISADGEPLKHHSLGNAGNDVADKIISTADGGYLLAGESSLEYGGDMQTWLAKISPEFDIEWQWRKGGKGRHRFNDMLLLPNGDVVAAGNGIRLDKNKKPLEEPWIVKLSKDGNLIWHSKLKLEYAASIRGLLPAQDDGFVVAGYSKPSDSFDSWIGKISQSGELIWEKAIDMPGADFLFSLQRSPSGQFIATGAANNGQTGFDAQIISFTEDQGKAEVHYFEKPGTQRARSLIQLDNGKVVLTGSSNLKDSHKSQAWFLKTTFPFDQQK